MLYTNTKAQVLFSDSDTPIFDIFAEVLQDDTFAPYLFVIAIDYAMRLATEKPKLGFTLQKARSRRYPAQTYHTIFNL